VPYVNVQPYSGSPANAAVYFATMKPYDVIMGMSLDSGGHLTHGVPNITFSGKYFTSIQYTVGKDELIDYDKLAEQVKKVKPKMLVAGTTHYPRIINWKKFSEMADSVGAYLLADVSHVVGLIISGDYPSPVPYAHIVTTTTHKTLRGPRGAMIMVTERGLNKNSELDNRIAKAIIPGMQGGPHNNVTAALAVSLHEADTKVFNRYGNQVVKNAKTLANELKKLGYKLVADGTDTHVIVVDLRDTGILGNTAAEALEKAGIIINANKVPFDSNPPLYPSGIRMGTPGITSRGMGEKEMVLIAKLIDQVIKSIKKININLKLDSKSQRKKSNRDKIITMSKEIRAVKQRIKGLCNTFPVKDSYILK
jgi:glycine hydroxymethyltransferase